MLEELIYGSKPDIATELEKLPFIYPLAPINTLFDIAVVLYANISAPKNIDFDDALQSVINCVVPIETFLSQVVAVVIPLPQPKPILTESVIFVILLKQEAPINTFSLEAFVDVFRFKPVALPINTLSIDCVIDLPLSAPIRTFRLFFIIPAFNENPLL